MIDNPEQQQFWKRCSSCKKEIPFGAKYYECSVTACKHERKGVRFCSVSCWDIHRAYANHRSSYAEELTAPLKTSYHEQDNNSMEERTPKRVVIQPPSSLEAPSLCAPAMSQEEETLVVVSKVKKFIKEHSDFNTSQCCIDALTRKVLEECKKGIVEARKAGRKTVMGRDIKS